MFLLDFCSLPFFFFFFTTGTQALGVLSNYSYKMLVIPGDVCVFQLEMVQLNHLFFKM